MIKATIRVPIRLETKGFGAEHWDGEFTIEATWDLLYDPKSILQNLIDFLKEHPEATILK